MNEPASLADMLAQFGEVEIAPLPKFGRIAAQRLAQSWPQTPQVTHHDEADVTELERGRKAIAAGGGPRITALPYIVKAVVSSLQAFPTFNGAFDPATGKVILRRYYNVGVAIDTPNGLLVGVVRGCDGKSVAEINEELTKLSEKARAKGLSYDEVTGGGFTVSSLGGLGGTAFTPIVNPPEVAILGLTRVRETAVRGEGDSVQWRLMLPLSLSYDHRVINGADAARFVTHLRAELESLRPGA
jgi:pyruvate dehydrogenase E2 component (dihydrolipoamide acetyltransferase)